MFIWCIVIASWDLILGYAGIFNYAQLVFFAVGAYSAAMLSIYAEITPLLSIACAGVIGAVAGALVSLPSLRLKGEYVALFTFAVHLALPPIIQQGKAIGMGGKYRPAGRAMAQPVRVPGLDDRQVDLVLGVARLRLGLRLPDIFPGVAGAHGAGLYRDARRGHISLRRSA